MSTTTTVLYIGCAPVVFLLYWIITAFFVSASFAPPPHLHNARIVLLIAHPDDEAMFFSPTLLALTDPSLGNHLKILCLSTGNADGLGTTRKRELIQSALTLGVRREEDVFVLDDARFVDGMDKDWKATDIAQLLAEAFAAPDVANGKSSRASGAKVAPNENPRSRPSASVQENKPNATIDVMITFDKGGVSNHPNHRALYSGAVLFLRNLMKGHSGWECPVTLYTLPTVNILRKYSSMLDALVTMAVGATANIISGMTGDKKMTRVERGQERVLFINGLQQYWRAREAMVKGHRSQMVWFRWGWITLGRYMKINDLRREKL